MRPESRRGRARSLLAAALLAATPALAETGSEWFEAQVRAGAPEPEPSRARFMACGYVAPALSRLEAPPSADSALMQMLEGLRAYLRRLGSAP